MSWDEIAAIYKELFQPYRHYQKTALRVNHAGLLKCQRHFYEIGCKSLYDLLYKENAPHSKVTNCCVITETDCKVDNIRVCFAFGKCK